MHPGTHPDPMIVTRPDARAGDTAGAGVDSRIRAGAPALTHDLARCVASALCAAPRPGRPHRAADGHPPAPQPAARSAAEAAVPACTAGTRRAGRTARVAVATGFAAAALARSAALAGLIAATLMTAAAPAAVQTSTWFDGARPGALAQEAVALLADAGAEGLDPADYDAAALQAAIAAAAHGDAATQTARARLDAALTAALLRFLTDLNQGRIDPRKLGVKFDLPRREFDAAAALHAARAAGRLDDAVRAATPPLQLYASLRSALATYRGLASHPAWHGPLPALPGGANGKLETGQAWDGLPLLAQRLQALGDLLAGALDVAVFDAPLVAAVRAFQRRHGLADDGVLGRATRAALEVAPAARAAQLALAMERLRWTPLAQGPRMIVVNLPEFVLRAYAVQGERFDVRLTMKVIVGRALDMRTPLIGEALKFIEFSPYWNVPRSIVRDEIAPRLQRDPGWLAREGFEFISPAGGVAAAAGAPAVEAVLQGQLRLRQRPGPRNPLGGIKFVFPNDEGIYLHHTPAPQLFERERRDFSHGCIRLEDPVALARFVLDDAPEWTEQRIRAAMDAGSSRTLRLAQPVPVLIAYATALVVGGRPHFFADVYGHDRQLVQALRQRPASTVIRADPLRPR